MNVFLVAPWLSIYNKSDVRMCTHLDPSCSRAGTAEPGRFREVDSLTEDK